MDTPLVSIIIPVYNRATLIVETLQSICNQSYTHWECIIVDDGSSDASWEIIEGFIASLDVPHLSKDQFRLYKRPEVLIKGADACRNYGFLKSNGDLVNWFDSDDIMLTDHLEKKVSAMQQDVTLDVCFCFNQSFVVKEEKPSLGKINSFREDNLLRDLILRKQFVQTGCGLWRSEFIKKSFATEAIFDEELTQSQDYDFYGRILAFAPNMTIIKEPLFLFRRGNHSISTDFNTANEIHLDSFLRARLKIIERYQGDDQIQRGVLNAILGSWNQQLHQQSKAAFITYVNGLDSCKNWVAPVFARAINKKIQLATLLRMLGRGSHRFREKFKI